ncbi:uncharacterized protein LOC124117103 [Haliotis rufescens]|uniref:uncharacterized protein LOC124117103 n=1 Tax=Haliotis rufescens TaxID=6454 RepID=UPI00201EE676|nr:uncharacterized protein LOC124117103 [Haliotis rufescens]
MTPRYSRRSRKDETTPVIQPKKEYPFLTVSITPVVMVMSWEDLVFLELAVKRRSSGSWSLTWFRLSSSLQRHVSVGRAVPTSDDPDSRPWHEHSLQLTGYAGHPSLLPVKSGSPVSAGNTKPPRGPRGEVHRLHGRHRGSGCCHSPIAVPVEIRSGLITRNILETMVPFQI